MSDTLPPSVLGHTLYTEEQYEADMKRAREDCPERELVRCALARGHEGPCWSGSWVRWGALTVRCHASRREGEDCIRAAGHRGEHEGQDGQTWRQRRGQR